MVVFDPLDGSSNLDAGISTGSIFGIYAPSEECRCLHLPSWNREHEMSHRQNCYTPNGTLGRLRQTCCSRNGARVAGHVRLSRHLVAVPFLSILLYTWQHGACLTRRGLHTAHARMASGRHACGARVLTCGHFVYSSVCAAPPGQCCGTQYGKYCCSVDDMEDPEAMMQNCILNVCQPGSALLAAGYCLYSSSTVFVLTIGQGVYGFTYDSIVGEFVLSHPDMKARAALRWTTCA